MADSPFDSKNKEQLLERILNSLTTGVFVTDEAYNVRYINDAYAHYLNASVDEVLGRPITDFIPDSHAPLVTTSGQAEMGELRSFKGPNGEERIIIVNRLPFKDGDKIVGMLSFTLFSSREEYNVVAQRVAYLDKKLNSYKRRIQSALSPKFSLQSILGKGKAITSFQDLLVRYAQVDLPVLITGATGTGKELAANALHCESLRKDGPFVSINCAAIPKELFETELFGYAPGAFSGAHKDGMVGKIELADQGTLFLDEVGDTPLDAQAKLLRVLEEHVLFRVGSSQPRNVNFQVISATNRDLRVMIREGTFREDLYYRINSLTLNMPTLRERREDIPLLVDHLLKRMERSNVKITDSAMALLMEHCWPGNVRELRNVIIRALSLCRGNVIEMGDLPPEILNDFGECPIPYSQTAPVHVSLQSMLSNNELRLIILTLQEHNWNVSQSAKRLGISRATMYEKLKKYNITRENCLHLITELDNSSSPGK